MAYNVATSMHMNHKKMVVIQMTTLWIYFKIKLPNNFKQPISWSYNLFLRTKVSTTILALHMSFQISNNNEEPRFSLHNEDLHIILYKFEKIIGMAKTKIVAMSFNMMFTKVWSLNISFSNNDKVMQLTNT